MDLLAFCPICQCHHGLPSDEAKMHALILMDHLRQFGRLDFTVPLDQADPQLSTEFLYRGRGRMFGVLVAEDGQGRRFQLKAFSSSYHQRWNIADWAPPLMVEAAYVQLVREGDERTRSINVQMKQLDRADPLWKKLHQKRQGISLEITQRIFDLYQLSNFRGETRPLFQASTVGARLALGTGDCCAPKLLNQAQKMDLKPLSLAEFYWGRATEDGQRQEGLFYPVCSRRCQPILGFMLCGGVG